MKSSYDDIERVLQTYKIKYDLIQLKDFEKDEVFSKYNVLFLPCGMEKPLDMNINVLSMGMSIKSVKLDKKYKELDVERISYKLKEFVENGGSVYLSGYSYKFVDKAFDSFKYFDGFPFMGLPGRIVASLKGDLSRFCLKNSMALYMTFPGWVALSAVKDGEVLADATFETPRGTRTGPMTVLLKRGEGLLLFTGYYSTVYSNFRRFNIYRIAGNKILNKLIGEADKWEQKVTGKIVDGMLPSENYRIYKIDLKEGTNFIYFLSENIPFQIDIFDSGMNLLKSIDSFETKQFIKILYKKKGSGYVKVYRKKKKLNGTYSIITVCGNRFVPYYKKIGYTLLGIIIFISFTVSLQLFGGRKHSGRLR